MNPDTISLLLAMLGSACLAAAWLGRKNDARRDTLMMSAVGGAKLALALGWWLAVVEA
jgi:hypothetical protein